MLGLSIIRSSQYAQDIFTVQASYLGGRPPVSVNMHWRRFRIDSIPIDDPAAFDIWLRDRWTEKDKLLGIYYRTGRFPADKGIDKTPDGKVRQGAGYIETEVKSVRWYEFLQIFAPIGLFALVLYMFYGAMPKQLVSSTGGQLSCNTMNKLQEARIKSPRKPTSPLQGYPISKSRTIPKAGMSASRLAEVKNQNAALATSTTRTIPARTITQVKMFRESQQTRSKNNVARTKNRSIKTSSHKKPLEDFTITTTKKDTNKMPELECGSQLARRHVDSRPGMSSSSKKPGLQIIKSNQPIHHLKQTQKSNSKTHSC